MVDIHCHILPGLDDGAKDIETSVAMCRTAAENGTTAIACSAHCNNEFTFDPATVERKIEEVMAETEGSPKLYPACDFHLSYENIQSAFADPHRYTINHKQYLLVEFTDFAIPSQIGDVFNEMRNRGVVPIVTHPERNPLLLSRPEVMYDWVEEGALIQVTANSVAGTFGKSAYNLCEWLLDRQMVHFIASDAHNITSRTTNLMPARKAVARMVGDKIAHLLMTEWPQAVIDGEDIYCGPPRRRSKTVFGRLASSFRRR